jgi:hypothetical protein
VWAAAALPILAIGILVHFAFALLAPFAVVLVAVLAARRQWWALMSGAALATFAVIPYVAHLHQTHWIDVQLLRDLIAKPASVDAEGPALVMSWATSWDTWYLEFVHLDRLLPGRISAVAANVQTALVAIGVGVGIGAALRVRRTRADRDYRWTGLLLWLLVPTLLSIRHTLSLGEQYFPVIAPAAALLVGAAIYWLSLRASVVGRLAFGLALFALTVLAAIHVVMIARLLDYVDVNYNDTYGLPVEASRAVADDLVAFGSRTNAAAAAIEYIGPESGAIGYLIRPHYPLLHLNGVGEVGLGASRTRPAPREVAAADMRDFGPVQRPTLEYTDGVRAVEAMASARWTPGKRIRLALLWAREAGDLGSTAPVTWEVTLYNIQGARVESQVGSTHAASDAPGSMISIFSIPTETGTPRTRLHLGVRRVDGRSVGATEVWRTEAIEPDS